MRTDLSYGPILSHVLKLCGKGVLAYSFAWALSLTGCATITEGSQQPIAFETPGATNALCDIQIGSDDYSYSVRPPQTIWIRKGRGDMKITCEAPAHRVVLKTVPSKPTGAALLNVMNGAVPGAVVDADSGALYKYPDVISIDFTGVKPTASAYPAYHNSDTLGPSDVNGIESYESDNPALQGDRALAARHQAAYDQAAREEALEAAKNAEKQRRIDALEGGFYGDKGHTK